MGDPLYLQHPDVPDERDLAVRGVRRTAAAPTGATFINLLPNANYVYDPFLRFWVPQEQATPGLIAILQQIAAYAEGTDETAAGIIASWLSRIKRQGTPNLLYGTTQPRIRTAADGDAIAADGTRQGTQYVHDFGALDMGPRRKFLGVDAGAYTAPGAGATTVSFTGVNLLGRIGFVWNVTDWMRHEVTNVVDPVPPAVGTITLRPAIPTAGAILIVPFTDTPHAWNAAMDATQSVAVVGDPPRINGPATFIAIAAAVIANGTTQYVLPTALYARQGIQISWFCLGTSTLQFNIYGKIDDAAWPAAGTIPAGYLINAWMQTTPGGIAFGAPPLGGGAAATPNIIESRIQDPTRWNSIAVEMVATNTGGNSTVTGTESLAGGTA